MCVRGLPLPRDAERESQFFAELPAADMFAVSQLVLDVALVDLTHADRVKSLIKDLWDIRWGGRTLYRVTMVLCNKLLLTPT